MTLKILRTLLFAVVAALLAWIIGMWLAWDAYSFWQADHFPDFPKAGITRLVMLTVFLSAGLFWFMRESRR